MPLWPGHSKLILFSAVALVCLAVQGLVTLGKAKASYHEDFNTRDLNAVLDGQIVLSDRISPWTIWVNGKNLVWSNISESHSLHYQDINWVRFDAGGEITRLENATVSVTVIAKNNTRGGAGVLVGSGVKNRYWSFNIDDSGNYHVLRKEWRRLAPVSQGSHPAIKRGQPNAVTFRREEGAVAFLVNDQEVVRVPTEDGRHLEGIGLTAYGAGSFKFDDLIITQ